MAVFFIDQGEIRIIRPVCQVCIKDPDPPSRYIRFSITIIPLILSKNISIWFKKRWSLIMIALARIMS